MCFTERYISHACQSRHLNRNLTSAFSSFLQRDVVTESWFCPPTADLQSCLLPLFSRAVCYESPACKKHKMESCHHCPPPRERGMSCDPNLEMNEEPKMFTDSQPVKENVMLWTYPQTVADKIHLIKNAVPINLSRPTSGSIQTYTGTYSY